MEIVKIARLRRAMISSLWTSPRMIAESFESPPSQDRGCSNSSHQPVRLVSSEGQFRETRCASRGIAKQRAARFWYLCSQELATPAAGRDKNLTNHSAHVLCTQTPVGAALTTELHEVCLSNAASGTESADATDELLYFPFCLRFLLCCRTGIQILVTTEDM